MTIPEKRKYLKNESYDLTAGRPVLPQDAWNLYKVEKYALFERHCSSLWQEEECYDIRENYQEKESNRKVKLHQESE